MVGMIRVLGSPDDKRISADAKNLSGLHSSKNSDYWRAQDERLSVELKAGGGDVKKSCNTSGLPLYVDIPLLNSGDQNHSDKLLESVSTRVMEGPLLQDKCTESPLLDGKCTGSLVSYNLTQGTRNVAREEKHDAFLSFECFDINKKRKNGVILNSHFLSDKSLKNGNVSICDAKNAEMSTFDMAILERKSKEIVLKENTYVYKRRKTRNSEPFLAECSKSSPKEHGTHYRNEIVKYIPPSDTYEYLLSVEINCQRHCGNDFMTSDLLENQKNKNQTLTSQIGKMDAMVATLALDEEIREKLDKIDISIIPFENNLQEHKDSAHNKGGIDSDRNSTKINNGSTPNKETAASTTLVPNFRELEENSMDGAQHISSTDLSDSFLCSHSKQLQDKQNVIHLPLPPDIGFPGVIESSYKRDWGISLNSIVRKYVALDFKAVNYTAAEHPGVVGDGKYNKKCKVCGVSEDTTSTLICDLCEESFHVYCCSPKIISVPLQDEWYCVACRRKRRHRGNLDGIKFHKGSPCKIFNGKYMDRKRDIFECMLEDNGEYISRARIGRIYQADIPECHDNLIDCPESPFLEYIVSLEETELEMKLAKENLENGILLNGWREAKSLPVCSEENWLQCRNIIYYEGEICKDGQKAKKDKICGKWRRAPVSEVQTDEWECSCAVLWDPVHADCNVPQELSTEEIFLRMKAAAIEMEKKIEMRIVEEAC
eukprot:TRINITY_DN3227_c0_g1_i1.p1 TRINITY_DN3227_c0_g1~~TRINITY_DN3227_c0_g1_i1.p1  ORF type:complete len:713 (+),score=153.67 TRINITY_DN3227_c0_g1_i1:516-2654(+)